MRSEDTPSERWRPVPGWEGLYEVSDLGRVWSVPRLDEKGRRCGGRILRLRPKKKGYWHVALSRGRGTRMDYGIHRLVLMAFSGLPAPGMQARHLNGNPSDNRLVNLAWGTCKENAADRSMHGTELRGVQRATSKLTPDDVRDIRADTRSQRVIGAEYGISGPTVCNIRNRKTWRHVE